MTKRALSGLRKGDRVKDHEGHEGEVVALYNAQNKVRVRWHGGYSTDEPIGKLEAI